MISGDVKADVKQQETKELLAVAGIPSSLILSIRNKSWGFYFIEKKLLSVMKVVC